MTNIPADTVAFEILPRLPPRAVLRCKCLNKFFYNLISSQKFINLHLQHSKSAARFLIVCTAVKFGKDRCLYLFDADFPNSPARYLPLPMPFSDDDNRYFQVVSSCHGLVCLNCFYARITDKMYHWLILNPSTGKVGPNISMTLTPAPKRVCSGLGYDRLNDDYKLLVVEYFYPPSEIDCIDGTRKVKLYSMKAQSWRCIEDTGLLCGSELMIPNLQSTCVSIDNNLLHWLFKLPMGMERSIVCFNLEKEQWAIDIPLPTFDDHREFTIIDLGVLDGCLCLSSNNINDKFNGWIMKEYGVQESWTKFSIDVPYRRFNHPIFATEKGAIEEILLVDWFLVTHNTVEWYNIRDKICKKVNLIGIPMKLRIQSVCLGSLVGVLGDPHTEKRKATTMEVDYTIKIRQDNMER